MGHQWTTDPTPVLIPHLIVHGGPAHDQIPEFLIGRDNATSGNLASDTAATATGAFSLLLGADAATTATGVQSIAGGDGVSNAGPRSVALGTNNTLSAPAADSIVSGSGNTVAASQSLVGGDQNQIGNGTDAALSTIVVGSLNTAIVAGVEVRTSAIFGSNNTVIAGGTILASALISGDANQVSPIADFSLTYGANNISNSTEGLVGGFNNIVQGGNDHIVSGDGHTVVANTSNSITTGRLANINAGASQGIVGGLRNVVAGRSSVVAGDDHLIGTLGVGAIVNGRFNEVQGGFSGACGFDLQSLNQNNFAVGRFNDPSGTANSVNLTDHLFTVGCGNNNAVRRNAFAALRWGGVQIYEHKDQVGTVYANTAAAAAGIAGYGGTSATPGEITMALVGATYQAFFYDGTNWQRMA